MTNQAEPKNNTETTQDTNETIPENKPRVVTSPGDVANLVLLQIDAVNAKKDELTIAMKNLTDTSKQLVRAYGEHTKTIRNVNMRLLGYGVN